MEDKPIDTLWWLAELDQHGNPTLLDGAHSAKSGAEKAYYIFARLGFTKGRKFAIAKVDLFEAVPNKDGVNEDALNQLNSIGLKP